MIVKLMIIMIVKLMIIMLVIMRMIMSLTHSTLSRSPPHPEVLWFAALGQHRQDALVWHPSAQTSITKLNGYDEVSMVLDECNIVYIYP